MTTQSPPAKWVPWLPLLAAGVLFFVTLFAKLPEQALEDPTKMKVGLVFDVGGLGDKSFNDSAYRGLLRAKNELGVTITTIEPGDGADRSQALRMLAASGHRLVFGVGFIFTDDLLQVAAEYPKVDFAGIDFALKLDAEGAPLPLPPNLVALKFKEEEGSFLTGALAATLSKTKDVGFVGGMDIPLIHKFSAGFAQGAKHVCPTCKVRIAFAGVTVTAFKDPNKGRELALGFYDAGSDIVFHAAGATGLGVFEAARERKRFAIGCDSDQQDEAPEQVITSLVKAVDTTVVEVARQTQAGQFSAGIKWFGLAQKGLVLARNSKNEKFFEPSTVQMLEALSQRIERSDIKVADHD